jgi:hypothetical protein
VKEGRIVVIQVIDNTSVARGAVRDQPGVGEVFRGRCGCTGKSRVMIKTQSGALDLLTLTHFADQPDRPIYVDEKLKAVVTVSDE